MIRMLLPLALSAISLNVAAQSVQSPEVTAPGVKTIRTKIICSEDRETKISVPGAEPKTEISKGKVSESLRTTWTDGKIEYRFSDFKGYRDSGKTLSAFGKTNVTFAVNTQENTVTEVTKSRSITQYVEPGVTLEGGNLKDRSVDTHSVYQVNGNQRTLISVVVDGKSQDPRGLIETEFKLTDTQKVLRFVEKTPYTDTRGDTTFETLKSEVTCLMEELQ